MAFKHGKNTVVLVGGSDLSAYLRDTSLSTSIDVAETSTFSTTDKTYVPGLIDSTLSCSGLYDGSLGAVDDVFATALGADSKSVITVFRGGAAVGDRAEVVYADDTSYELSSPVADVVSISASFQASEPTRGGILLNSFVPVSSSTTHTAQDNGASSSGGFIANLHVTANSRNGNTTVIIEQSSDNSTWTTLGSFAAVVGTTTVGSRISATGSVARYVRARSTLGGSSGSVTYAVAFARL